jgi:hypothetical protein
MKKNLQLDLDNDDNNESPTKIKGGADAGLKKEYTPVSRNFPMKSPIRTGRYGTRSIPGIDPRDYWKEPRLLR